MTIPSEPTYEEKLSLPGIHPIGRVICNLVCICQEKELTKGLRGGVLGVGTGAVFLLSRGRAILAGSSLGCTNNALPGRYWLA